MKNDKRKTSRVKTLHRKSYAGTATNTLSRKRRRNSPSSKITKRGRFSLSRTHTPGSSRTPRSSSSPKYRTIRKFSNTSKKYCKYDPFCFQTNSHHLSSFKHTPTENIDIEDILTKLQNERFRNNHILFNNTMKWSKAILKTPNSLTKQQFDKMMHLHTRIQEEAFPNMEIMSLLWNYKQN